MVPHPLTGAYPDTGSQVLWEDGERVFRRGWQQDDDGKRRTVLLLEDARCEPMTRLLGAPMEVGRFLQLAIAISVAVGKLHERGLVHKDIKPANILINEATDEVRLT